MSVIDEQTRNQLIRAVQAGVPLEDRPFASLGRDLGLSEDRVLGALHELRDQKILREISAVLEGSVLGWDSALVAGCVSKEKVESVAEIVSTHPTVTHNYLREHSLNLWFTVAVPPGMSLERTLDLLAQETGVERFFPLRRTHTFKIGVNFDPESLKNQTRVEKRKVTARIDVAPEAAARFRALQRPLPLVPEPFEELAAGIDTHAGDLLDFARAHLGGAIRRYVGTLRHRKLGVRENGMVVWSAPAQDIEALGMQLAAAPEVSHCYARNAIDDFPYTLYSMVHGPTQESCKEIAADLGRRTGLADHAVLFSTREFKKVRLRYFLPELDAWWRARTDSIH